MSILLADAAIHCFSHFLGGLRSHHAIVMCCVLCRSAVVEHLKVSRSYFLRAEGGKREREIEKQETKIGQE